MNINSFLVTFSVGGVLAIFALCVWLLLSTL